MESVDFVVAGLDGQIVRFGSCPVAMVPIQAASGEQAAQGYGRPETHYVWDGGIREFTAAQVLRRATKPSPRAAWDMSVMGWNDPRDVVAEFAEAKAERWRAIKAARVTAMDAPIDTPWGRFDANAPSRAAIAEAAAVQEPYAAIAWTTADNTVVNLARATLSELLRLIDQRTQQAHAQARVLRSQIEAASSVGDLEAITWPQAP